jgi:hypothetical protein
MLARLVIKGDIDLDRGIAWRSPGFCGAVAAIVSQCSDDLVL